MVSASRLKKAERQLIKSRPYFEAMEGFLNHLLLDAKPFESPLLTSRKLEKITAIVVTSERGLCGAFNSNMINKAQEFISQFPKESVSIISVGKKGREYFSKRGYEIIKTIPSELFDPASAEIKDITDLAVSSYLRGETDGVFLIYARFHSVSKSEPVVSKLLNLEVADTDMAGSKELDYIFEPEKSKILNEFLPRFIKMKVFMGFAESITSENGARMLAMKAATDNAKDMVESLTMIMNKARQAAITNEIMEIVTASEALKGK